MTTHRRHLLAVLSLALWSIGAAAQQPQAPGQAPASPPASPPATAAGAPGAAPQQPLATFRSSTRLVMHHVTAKDKDGRPIEGLTAADFIVTENNERQEIAFVEYQQFDDSAAPLDALAADTPPPALAPSTPDRVVQVEIATPPAGTVKYQDKRLLVLYFDQSAMPQADQGRAFDNARTFVGERMAAADVVAVMTFQNGSLRVRHDFTADRAALLEVINALQYGTDSNGDGIPDLDDGGTAFGQGDAEFSVFNTDRQLAALQTAVSMLRNLPEQKTLIYFGSGLRLNGSDNMAQLRATTNAAIRANVTINPVDARGLSASAPLGNANQASPGGAGMFSGAGATSALASQQQSQDSLFALAKDTGGRAMVDNNDLSLGIVQAARAATSYYIVAYYSTHTATDGKLRRVSIKLAGDRQGDLAYSPSYYGDKTFAAFSAAERERQLEEAFMLEDPVTEITIAMELNFFQLSRAEYYVPVAMKIPGSELTLARRRGAARTSIDFIGEIKDEYGITIQNIRDKVEIKLSDDDAEQLAKRPIQYENGYVLLPGKYVIKVLARDATTGRIGTYQTPFTIPNLVKDAGPLPISSVVLSSQRVAQGDELFSVANANDAGTNPLVRDGQKLIPSVTRVFSAGKEMYVYLEAYQRTAATQQPLVAFVTFYRGNERAFETMPLPILDGRHPKSKAVPMGFSIPLSGFAPGRYECQVTVLDPSAQKAAFWRMPVVVTP